MRCYRRYGRNSMTSFNIEKFKLDNEIRMSIIRNAGNIILVEKEINKDREVSIEHKYIKIVYDKQKKERHSKANRIIATDIVKLLLNGLEYRNQIYIDCITNLRKKLTVRISTCHSAPVTMDMWEGNPQYTCVHCDKTCGTKVVEQTSVHNLLLKFTEQLRKEDEHIVNFAEKLGYSDKIELPAQKTTHYNVVVHKDALDKDTLLDVDSLSGPDRQKLRRSLEKKMIESTIENNDNDNK